MQEDVVEVEVEVQPTTAVVVKDQAMGLAEPLGEADIQEAETLDEAEMQGEATPQAEVQDKVSNALNAGAHIMQMFVLTTNEDENSLTLSSIHSNITLYNT